jgi:hypothetical protein
MRRLLALVVAASAVACGGADPDQARVASTTQARYDPKTLKLAEITYDKNQNGRIDTWTKMDGAKPVSSVVDEDEDGKIDRWEEYGSNGELVKVQLSRDKNGQPDEIVYVGADGKVEHIDFLEKNETTGQFEPVRREFYESDRPTRAEEDTDGDGLMDRFEHYDPSGALIAVELDDVQPFDGKPDRRLSYSPTGQLLSVETQPDGRGGYQKKTVPSKK